MADIRTGLANYMRGLGRRRNNSTVTADDAHRFLDRKGIATKPIPGTSTSTTFRGRTTYINAVLNMNNTEITPTGAIRSKRAVARGRKITTWQYV